MTEFEFIEVASLARETVAQGAMDAITVVFAYVVAAHFAGNKLKPIAAISLSIVYSLWLMGPFIGVYSGVNFILANAEEFRNNYPDNYAVPSQSQTTYLLYVFALLPLLLGWLGSVLYMHAYIRKSKGETSHEDT